MGNVKTIVGKSFRTEGGVTFKVLAGEKYLDREIGGQGGQHRKYLMALRPGMLVSVMFHGTPVPVITTEDGVVRLTEIECNGRTCARSGIMSEALGVLQPKNPVLLTSE